MGFLLFFFFASTLLNVQENKYTLQKKRRNRRNKSLGLFQEANNKERAKICSSSYRYPTKAHLLTVFDKKVPDKYHKPHNPDDLTTSQELIL